MATQVPVQFIVICIDHQNLSNDIYAQSAIGQFYSSLLKGDPRQMVLYTDFKDVSPSRTTTQRFISLFREESKSPQDSEAVSKLNSPEYKNKILEIYLFIAKHYKENAKVSIFTAGPGAQIASAVSRIIGMIRSFPPGPNLKARIDKFNWVYGRLVSLTSNGENGKETKKNETNPENDSDPKITGVDFLGLWDAEQTGICRTIMPDSDFPVNRLRHALSLRSISAESFILKSDVSNVKDVSEVWFEGNGEEDNSLSRISLRWMIDACRNPEVALFDGAKLLQITQRKESSQIPPERKISQSELLPIVISHITRLVEGEAQKAEYLVPLKRPTGLAEKDVAAFKKFLETNAGGTDETKILESMKTVEDTSKAEESEAAKGSAGGSVGTKNVGSATNGLQWDQNVEVDDVISSVVTGEQTNQPDSNIHWTVRTRMDIINLLNESGFREKYAWPENGAKIFLGNTTVLPKEKEQ